jgi:Mn-dependent DtxR family transcriptional regulator
MDKLESTEDYLERILMLLNKNGHVRAIDIANDMSFSKASVSIALKKLKEHGMVEVNDESGNITLTEDGLNIAKDVYERHQILSKLLIEIGVDEETAFHDACKIEHDISIKTFNKIKERYYKNNK